MDKRKNPNLDEAGRPYRFKPGKSGNPSGRPKTRTLSDAYRFQLAELIPNDPPGRTWAQLIAEGQVRTAARGNVQAARELADRTEGKASQHLEITGNDGGPVEAASAIERLLDKLGR